MSDMNEFSWWNLATTALGAIVGMFWRKLVAVEDRQHALELKLAESQRESEQRFAKHGDIHALREELLRHLQRIESSLVRLVTIIGEKKED